MPVSSPRSLLNNRASVDARVSQFVAQLCHLHALKLGALRQYTSLSHDTRYPPCHGWLGPVQCCACAGPPSDRSKWGEPLLTRPTRKHTHTQLLPITQRREQASRWSCARRSCSARSPSASRLLPSCATLLLVGTLLAQASCRTSRHWLALGCALQQSSTRLDGAQTQRAHLRP